MAGARVEIHLDDAEFNAAFSRAHAKLTGEGVTLMLEDIGEYLMISTRARGDRQVDPDGDPWLALSPKYKKKKDKHRPGVPILKYDFHMLGDQLAYQVVGHDLFHGTAALYGATHQFGATVHTAEGTFDIPARPWLGLSDDDDAEVLNIIGDHLEGAFKP